MDNIPRCPKCGMRLDIDDCDDQTFDWEEGFLKSLCFGMCPRCKVNYRWEEHFVRTNISNLTEGWEED